MFENSSKDSALNKLLILYIFKHMDVPVSNSQLTQMVMEIDLLNYFVFQQFMNELIENELIDSDDFKSGYYKINKKGVETLNYFISRIPLDIRKKIDSYIIDNKENILKETQIKSTLKKKSANEFIVELSVLENESSLIDINLNLPSNKQAQLICDNWKKNAHSLYGEIIKLLIQ